MINNTKIENLLIYKIEGVTVESIIKEVDSFLYREGLIPAFGHSLLHSLSGLYELVNLKKTYDFVNLEFFYAVVLHDLGRSIHTNEDDHANRSVELAEEFLKDVNHKDLDNELVILLIRTHSNFKSSYNSSQGLFILVDYMVLKNKVENFNGELDRALLTKTEEVLYQLLGNEKPIINGFGKANSSATIELKRKVDSTKKDINSIVETYGELGVYAEKVLEVINSIEKTYFNKLSRLMYSIKIIFRYLLRPSIFIKLISLGWKYKSIKPPLFAGLVQKESEGLLEIKKIMSLQTDYDKNHQILMENNFNNSIFKGVMEQVLK